VVSQDLSEAREALSASEARAGKLADDLSEARATAENMRREMRNLAAQVRQGPGRGRGCGTAHACACRMHASTRQRMRAA
jgi:hypothetical protein